MYMMKITLKKIILCCSFIFSIPQVFAGDATISSTSFHRYIKVNNNRTVAGKIINAAGTNITSYRTGWKIDNGVANQDGLTNIGGGGLPIGGSYINFSCLDFLRTTVAGPHVLKIWVKATGDTNAANDTLTFNFTALSLNSYVDKVNLFEESTGTWCQYCPEGAAAIATIKPLPNTAVAVFHDGDIYAIPEVDTYFNTYFPGNIFTPGAMINMSENGNYIINTNRPAWLQEMNARANSITPVQFTMIPTYNIATRQLDVNVITNFKYVENGDYYTNVYIVENGIIGSQVNATNPYTHDNVVRKMLGGANGTSGIIPVTPVINTNYSNAYSFAIPATWNANNLSLIGMVFRKNGTNRNALNAAKIDFTQLLSTTNIVSKTEFSVSPNPANDYIKINDIQLSFGDKVSIYNMNGQLLINKELNADTTEINVSSLPSGMFLIKIKTDDGTQTKKFIKE
jgi:hypothetical protein